MKRITATLMTLAGLAFLFAGCKPDEPTKPNEYRQSYGIPTVSIVTDNKAPVVTREDHIPCTVKFFKTGASEPEFTSRGIIHTRGNATAGYPKKPYKIKLEEKYSMCGFPANRDWVLLAMHCDHSLMRECYMYTLSEKVGLPFTVRHQHVSVTLNGEQMGVYLLVDQVEKAEERVKLDDDGFIIERDGYYSREPLYFKTTRTGSPFTFKYPDADNGKIVEGDAEYNFIKDYVSKFEEALYGSNPTDPENGYRKYIDVRSWAKWYLVQELSGNMDTNHYFILRNHNSKLERGPVWDAEWSYGLAEIGLECLPFHGVLRSAILDAGFLIDPENRRKKRIVFTKNQSMVEILEHIPGNFLDFVTWICHIHAFVDRFFDLDCQDTCVSVEILSLTFESVEAVGILEFQFCNASHNQMFLFSTKICRIRMSENEN